MAQEIERKFLVKSSDYRAQASSDARIVQGYLNSAAERAVRVRIYGQQGFLTIKGKSNDSGTSRYEWEREIPLQDAEELLGLCEPGVIDKRRYRVEIDGYCFEVDEFAGDNQGLIMAEVELSDENESFPRPDWLGEEVTGQVAYYNSALSRHPFKSWA